MLLVRVPQPEGGASRPPIFLLVPAPCPRLGAGNVSRAKPGALAPWIHGLPGVSLSIGGPPAPSWEAKGGRGAGWGNGETPKDEGGPRCPGRSLPKCRGQTAACFPPRGVAVGARSPGLGWAVGSTAGGTSSPGSGPGPRLTQLRPPAALRTALSAEGSPAPSRRGGPRDQGSCLLPRPEPERLLSVAAVNVVFNEHPCS